MDDEQNMTLKIALLIAEGQMKECKHGGEAGDPLLEGEPAAGDPLLEGEPAARDPLLEGEPAA